MPLIQRETKRIFDIKDVPSFSEFYDLGIYPWKLVYRGYKSDWHEIKAPTISNPFRKRRSFRMNMAKALSSELANLVWAEGSKVIVSLKNNDSEDDPLQAYVDYVLRTNNFDSKMRQLVEECIALGGATIRAYVDGEKDEEGNVIDGHVCLSYGMADKFVPLKWDNARVTEGVFIEKKASKGWYWTRLEYHRWNGEEYVVSNEYYKTQNTSQDILGIRSPMCELWTLPDSVPFYNLKYGLFTYFRTSIANNLDDNSPLGMSVFANSMDTIRALDIAFDSLIMEMKLGRKRIIVPASAVRYVRDAQGRPQRYFDSDDEVFEALNVDSAEQLKIQDNTVSLRIDEHIKAINGLLNILSMQIGLSEGALSFDLAKGMKTATEVISENSKTFRTVKLMQRPIAQSIRELVDEILDVSYAYDVHFVHEGVDYRIADLIDRGYEVNVTFDDSIIQDRSADLAEGLTLLQNGLISKKTYLTEYYGYTTERADAELEILKQEASTPRTLNIDWTGVE